MHDRIPAWEAVRERWVLMPEDLPRATAIYIVLFSFLFFETAFNTRFACSVYLSRLTSTKIYVLFCFFYFCFVSPNILISGYRCFRQMAHLKRFYYIDAELKSATETQKDQMVHDKRCFICACSPNNIILITVGQDRQNLSKNINSNRLSNKLTKKSSIESKFS